MLSFSISSSHLNRLLKRLSFLVKKDDEASLTFVVDSNASTHLSVYYESVIDTGGDSKAYYSEEIPVTGLKNTGSYSVLAKELASIKIPEFTKVGSFPHVKSVNFKFNKSSLTLDYHTIWSDTAKPAATKLTYEIVGKDKDLKDYEKLTSNLSNLMKLNSVELRNSVAFCNFFKADATSKEGNGCLLRLNKGQVSVLGTDSNMAARYCGNSVTGKGNLNLVVSAPVFGLIDKFIADTEYVEVGTFRSNIVISTGSRRMAAPTMSTVDSMAAYEPLFNDKGPLVSEMLLKPVISSVDTLIGRSRDPHARILMSFKKNSLDLSDLKNSSKGIPCVSHLELNLPVNGIYFNTIAKKMTKAGPSAKLYYHDSTKRWTLESDDSKVMFLIQGLYE